MNIGNQRTAGKRARTERRRTDAEMKRRSMAEIKWAPEQVVTRGHGPLEDLERRLSEVRTK